MKRGHQKNLQDVISSRADFPASRSAQQEREKAQTTTAISGQKCVASFKSFPRATSWQRTFVDCLVSKGEWYSRQCVLTWKLSATKSNRLLSQLVPSTPRTEEIVSGLLPTSTENRSVDALLNERKTTHGTNHGLKLQPDFAGWMMGYPKGYLDLADGEMPPSKRTGTPSSPK
jgi:hypothetical protein